MRRRLNGEAVLRRRDGCGASLLRTNASATVEEQVLEAHLREAHLVWVTGEGYWLGSLPGWYTSIDAVSLDLQLFTLIPLSILVGATEELAAACLQLSSR